MSRINKKNSIGGRYIILIILVVLVILFAVLSYVVNHKKNLNKFEALFKDGTVYVEKILMKPFKYLGDKVTDYQKLENVLEKNDILEGSTNRVDTLMAENKELRRQLDAMKEELGITNVLSEYDYLNATVTSRNVLLWYKTITIDKGTSNGIEEGMAVVNASGLIGRTTNVTAFTSDVKLITTGDTNNKISVTISSGDNNLNGVMNGYNYKDNSLIVEGISNTDTVTVGDLVYTSGLGGVFPSGILIGKVKNIKTDSYDLAKIIEVEISANFDDLNYVAVLKRKNDQW